MDRITEWEIEINRNKKRKKWEAIRERNKTYKGREREKDDQRKRDNKKKLTGEKYYEKRKI